MGDYGINIKIALSTEYRTTADSENGTYFKEIIC
jgi:hypothetical protein